ncbi:MAG TPA: iron-sulfur cluster assembly scaffold protein [Chthonomonadaceae bacterium]|nr:iron-sulfur cluster assembly scaffold protein [Chthonomonadaceae bacterium]
MSYSELVRDHYDNPRNVGALDKNDPHVGTGVAGAAARGSLIRLQIKADPQTLAIEDAKFKTFGCGFSIAASSLVTEWLKGRTLEQARAITPEQIAEELALPPEKFYCAALAEEAIQAAIQDFEQKQIA